MIVEAKEKYTNKLSKKLDDPSTMPKGYWSILNTFLNNKKAPNIPPLNVNGKIISNFDNPLIQNSVQQDFHLESYPLRL